MHFYNIKIQQVRTSEVKNDNYFIEKDRKLFSNLKVTKMIYNN